MHSIHNLPSWSRDKLTEEQKQQYETIPVGESFHSLRTKFRVRCMHCNKVIHESTNDPSFFIEKHKCQKQPPK